MRRKQVPVASQQDVDSLISLASSKHLHVCSESHKQVSCVAVKVQKHLTHGEGRAAISTCSHAQVPNNVANGVRRPTNQAAYARAQRTATRMAKGNAAPRPTTAPAPPSKYHPVSSNSSTLPSSGAHSQQTNVQHDGSVVTTHGGVGPGPRPAEMQRIPSMTQNNSTSSVTHQRDQVSVRDQARPIRRDPDQASHDTSTATQQRQRIDPDVGNASRPDVFQHPATHVNDDSSSAGHASAQTHADQQASDGHAPNVHGRWLQNQLTLLNQQATHGVGEAPLYRDMNAGVSASGASSTSDFGLQAELSLKHQHHQMQPSTHAQAYAMVQGNKQRILDDVDSGQQQQQLDKSDRDMQGWGCRWPGRDMTAAARSLWKDADTSGSDSSIDLDHSHHNDDNSQISDEQHVMMLNQGMHQVIDAPEDVARSRDSENNSQDNHRRGYGDLDNIPNRSTTCTSGDDENTIMLSPAVHGLEDAYADDNPGSAAATTGRRVSATVTVTPHVSAIGRSAHKREAEHRAGDDNAIRGVSDGERVGYAPVMTAAHARARMLQLAGKMQPPQTSEPISSAMSHPSAPVSYADISVHGSEEAGVPAGAEELPARLSRVFSRPDPPPPTVVSVLLSEPSFADYTNAGSKDQGITTQYTAAKSAPMDTTSTGGGGGRQQEGRPKPYNAPKVKAAVGTVSVHDPISLKKAQQKVSELGVSLPPLCGCCSGASVFDPTYTNRCSRNCSLWLRPDLHDHLLNQVLMTQGVTIPGKAM